MMGFEWPKKRLQSAPTPLIPHFSTRQSAHIRPIVMVAKASAPASADAASPAANLFPGAGRPKGLKKPARAQTGPVSVVSAVAPEAAAEPATQPEANAQLDSEQEMPEPDGQEGPSREPAAELVTASASAVSSTNLDMQVDLDDEQVAVPTPTDAIGIRRAEVMSMTSLDSLSIGKPCVEEKDIFLAPLTGQRSQASCFGERETPAEIDKRTKLMLATVSEMLEENTIDFRDVASDGRRSMTAVFDTNTRKYLGIYKLRVKAKWLIEVQRILAEEVVVYTEKPEATPTDVIKLPRTAFTGKVLESIKLQFGINALATTMGAPKDHRMFQLTLTDDQRKVIDEAGGVDLGDLGTFDLVPFVDKVSMEEILLYGPTGVESGRIDTCASLAKHLGVSSDRLSISKLQDTARGMSVFCVAYPFSIERYDTVYELFESGCFTVYNQRMLRANKAHKPIVVYCAQNLLELQEVCGVRLARPIMMLEPEADDAEISMLPARESQHGDSWGGSYAPPGDSYPLPRPGEDEGDDVYGVVMSIEELRDLPDDAGFVMVPFRLWQQLQQEQSASQSVNPPLRSDEQLRQQVELEMAITAENFQPVNESSGQLTHPYPRHPHPHAPIEASTTAAPCAALTSSPSSPLSPITSPSSTTLRLTGGEPVVSLLPPEQPPAEAPPPEPPPPPLCRCGFVMRSQSGDDLRSRHQLACKACPADERDAAWASYEAAWRACSLMQRDESYDGFSAALCAYTAAADQVPWGAPYECGRCGYSCGVEDNWSRHVGRCEEAFNIGYQGAPPGPPTPSTYLAYPLPLPNPLPQAKPTFTFSYLAPVPNIQPHHRTPHTLHVPPTPAETPPPPAEVAVPPPPTDVATPPLPAPPRSLKPASPRLHLRGNASLMSAAATRRVMRLAPSGRQVPLQKVAPGPLHRRSRRGQRSRRGGRRRRTAAGGQEGRPGVPRCRARYGEGAGRSRSGPTSIH
jgi:hypothetical protein